jgi:hypothetical protein
MSGRSGAHGCCSSTRTRSLRATPSSRRTRRPSSASVPRPRAGLLTRTHARAVERASAELRAYPAEVDARLAVWERKHAERARARKAKKGPEDILKELLAKM